MVSKMFSKPNSALKSILLCQGSKRLYAAYGLLAACALHPQPAFVQSSEHGADLTEDGSVRLNEITLTDQLSWSVLKIVAPERLQEIVPVYIYTVENTRGDSEELPKPCLELAFQDPDAGTICFYGEVRTELDQDHTLDFFDVTLPSSNGGRLALNHRVPDNRPENILWMSRHAWLEAVQRQEQFKGEAL